MFDRNHDFRRKKIYAASNTNGLSIESTTALTAEIELCKSRQLNHSGYKS